MRIANGTLILVADGREMLLLRNTGDEKYAVLSTVDHAESFSARTATQGTDAPGSTHAHIGNRHSTYDNTDWHQQDEDRFAATAADRLRQAAGTGDSGIVVIAPPRTLGVLRKHYGKAVEGRLIAEIAKDFIGHVSDDIGKVIANHAA